jgi:NAD-dependent DNA ligase
MSEAGLDNRQINELIELAHGIIADRVVNQAEVRCLFKWIAANVGLSENPIIKPLFDRVSQVLADGVLDSEEAVDLLETLNRFCARDFGIGEALKATSLPFCDPVPTLTFQGSSFCLTGTFASEARTEREAAVASRGGCPTSFTQKTTYLIVGAHVTDSWAHSSYGRKIEKAAGMRASGIPISFVG